MADVTLLKSRWVIRRLRVATERGVWVVEYRGYYIGWEAVFVDDRLAQQKASTGFSMVPRFDFAIGPHRATLKLEFSRKWSLIFPKISKLILELDDHEVYREGHILPRASARFS